MAYKIRHIETGLFFTKARSVRLKQSDWKWVKSNLSKRGRLYEFKPTEKQIKSWTGTFIYGEQGELLTNQEFEVVDV